MTLINVNGYALRYSEKGTGDPLVLVHGSASDYRTWQHQQTPFSNHFRTIVYSRRYHWPNQPIPDGIDYAMLRHVDDLKEVLHTLRAMPAHLVGHSYGAFLCLLLAIQEPHFVRRLVLAEPPAITLFVSNNPQPMEILKLMVTRPRIAAAIIKFGVSGVGPARRAIRGGDVDTGIRKFGEAVFGRGGYDRLPAGRKAQVRDNRANVKAEIIGPGFASLSPKRVRSIAAPVLLLKGAHSVPLFRHLIDGLRELLPNAETVTIENATHMMHEDSPTAFNRAVLSFLTEANGINRGDE